MPLRELSSVIVFVIVVALGYAPSRGESNLTGAFYNKPVELRLERSIRKSFGRYLREQASDFYQRRPFDQLVPESFYPIGWSRVGNFAYYVEPVDEACGGFHQLPSRAG